MTPTLPLWGGYVASLNLSVWGCEVRINKTVLSYFMRQSRARGGPADPAPPAAPDVGKKSEPEVGKWGGNPASTTF